METELKKKEETEIGPLVAGTTGAIVGVSSWLVIFFVTFNIVNGDLGLRGFFFNILTIPCSVLMGLVTGAIVGSRLKN
jgi:hypothetical protein